MTDPATPETQPPADEAARQPDAPDVDQQTWATLAIVRTFRALGAKIGLAWIGVIIVLAVFGPFLANSQPIAAKVDGEWTSPMLRHLNAADVCFLFGFVTCLIIGCTRRLTAEARMALMLVLVGSLSLVAAYPTLMDVTRGWYLSKPDAIDETSFSRKAANFFETISNGALLYVIKALLAGIGFALFAWLLHSVQPKGLASKRVHLGWAALVLVFLTCWTVRPPRLVEYDMPRRQVASGEIESVVWAPLRFSPKDRLRDQFDATNPHPRDPTLAHPLGTDRNGSDVLSGMVHASRIALSVGFIAEGIALIIGVTLGALMGYFAGAIDLIGMRLVEIFTAIPRLYLLLTFVAFFGGNIYLIMVIIGLTSWTGYTMYTRAEFLRLRKRDFVQAAEALGVPTRRLMFRHILPNGLAPVLVSLSFGVASAILAEATLSFLGVGEVDTPSWGALLNQALTGGGFHWPLATFPGLAIFLTVFAYNLIGESMRDAIDPHAVRQSNL